MQTIQGTSKNGEQSKICKNAKKSTKKASMKTVNRMQRMQ